MSIVAILTGATCGEACWSAREEVCRCSCGGKNHGISLSGGETTRTAKIDSVRYKLEAVGKHSDLLKEAWKINKSIIYSIYWDSGYKKLKISCKGHLDKEAPARVRYATSEQVKRWRELEVFKTENGLGFDRSAALLWVRTDFEALQTGSPKITPTMQKILDLYENYNSNQRQFIWYQTIYDIIGAESLQNPDNRVWNSMLMFNRQVLITIETYAEEIERLAGESFCTDGGYAWWLEQRGIEIND